MDPPGLLAVRPDMPLPLSPLPPWPYPFWIAHRGAGRLAPENTLAAFRLGARLGWRMFECDVTLSADGVPFLLHDATLTRTTDARQALGEAATDVAGDHPWSVLSQLDAGRWHSPAFAGEPLPTLEAVARFSLASGCALNLELKPGPGMEHRTGVVVAREAARLWGGAAPAPLLTSFSVAALEGARAGAPDLPRGLLLDSLGPGWLDAARALGCVAVVVRHDLWNASAVAAARAAGLRLLSYTVNDEAEAARLAALGLDGLITDQVDRFGPARPAPGLQKSPLTTGKPSASQSSMPPR